MNSFSSLPFFLPADSVAFFGRSFNEYLRFFQFTPSDFRGRSVLDVGAGPSSFTADARRLGVNAVAVDPLYGCTPAALSTHVQLDYRAMHARMRLQPGCFRFHTFASFEEAERDRSEAARRFLADYEAHFAHDRYIGAALPSLPFADDAFDFVLCAHLLFIYAARFDYSFHLAAFKELARVARCEVRVHPVCGADGKPYGELDRLRRELAAFGIESEVRPVDHEFFAGTGTTLFLSPPSPDRSFAPVACVDARVCGAPS